MNRDLAMTLPAGVTNESQPEPSLPPQTHPGLPGGAGGADGGDGGGRRGRGRGGAGAGGAGGEPPLYSPATRRATIEALINAHGDAVYGFCVRLLRTRERAEDVVQQVFLEAYRDLHRFAHQSSIRTWLFGIARHRCMDVIREQQRAKLVESDEHAVLHFVDPGAGPVEHLDRRRRIEMLEDCLKRLSPEARMTVLMRFQTDASYEELARMLAETAGALQVRVSRALPALRRCLERKGWTGVRQ
jgi:RNA polymerase sigma factor (sigma-70 family)